MLEYLKIMERKLIDMFSVPAFVRKNKMKTIKLQTNNQLDFQYY